jgi:hypothetical protein
VENQVPSSTINGKVTKTIILGQGGYGSPLIVTQTGSVTPTEAGASGIVVPAGFQGGSITNHGNVSGGAGGGKTLGGGIGIDMAAAAGIVNTGTLTGGTGGYAGTKVGVGGIGVDLLAGGSVVNSGDIAGGVGGSSPVTTGGNGGTGVALQGATTLDNTGTIAGGAGAYFSGGNNNYAFSCGSGGVGVDLFGGGTATNTGTILGGNAGRQNIYALAGNGGNGVDLAASTLSNGGTITGGSGTYATVYPGGSAGTGVNVSAAGVLTNSGTITGGAGGGSRYGSGAAGGTVINTGTIIGGAGGGTYYGIPGYGGIGAVINGGKLLTSGTIAGGAGLHNPRAVYFGAAAGTLALDPGAVIDGSVTARAADTLELSSSAGNSVGKLSGGLGIQFTGFGHVAVDKGATWSLAGSNYLYHNSSVAVAGTLLVGGTLADAGQIGVAAGATLGVIGPGSVQVESLSLAGGALTGDAKGSIAVGATAGAAGAIGIEVHASLTGFGTIGGAEIDNRGSIVAEGGTLTLATGLTSAGSGIVHIDSGAVLVADSFVQGGQIAFGGPARLLLVDPKAFTGTIASFGSGDVIDVESLAANKLTFAAGTLTLKHGSTVLDTLMVSGHLTAADFGLSSDGHGGTDVSFVSSTAAHISTGGLWSADDAAALAWHPILTPHIG